MCIKIKPLDLLNNLHLFIVLYIGVVIAGEFFCITALSHSLFIINIMKYLYCSLFLE